MLNKLFSSGFFEYELIDAGGNKKIERFGDIVLIRPELQAYFKSSQSFLDWKVLAHSEFVEKNKKWSFYKKCNPKWTVNVEGLKIILQFTSFKHIGIFPEQFINWKFLVDNIKKNDSFLNLFAYTGVSSLIASKHGANVCHVDSVKNIIDWGKECAQLNNLSNIKWIIDDVLTFTKREIKRQKKYDFICLDPPAFGFGKNGKKWILDQKIDELLLNVSVLLSKNGKVVINTYSPKLELFELVALCEKYFANRKFDSFELWQKTKSGKELFYGNCVRIF